VLTCTAFSTFLGSVASTYVVVMPTRPVICKHVTFCQLHTYIHRGLLTWVLFYDGQDTDRDGAAVR
jgi:hypothetical protein